MAIVINGSGTVSGLTAQASDVELTDSTKVLLGTGDDLQIYHSGSHSFIDDVGTGNLNIRGENIIFQKADGSEKYMDLNADGAVELWDNNVKKLETTSTGVDVTGSVVADGASLDGAVTINDTGADVDFRVEGSGEANALFVQGSNGAVGIGTASPSAKLEVCTTGGGSLATVLINGGTDGGSDGGSRLHMKYGGSQKWAIQHRNQTSIGSAHALVIGDADLDNGAYINQNSNSWSAISDERLKTSISQIENAVDKLNTLQAINFKWKYGSEERKIQNNLGLLAQEVYEVFPEAVDYHEIEDFELIDHPTIEGTKQAKDALGISPTVLIAPLVKAIQELSAKNEELTTRIEALENP